MYSASHLQNEQRQAPANRVVVSYHRTVDPENVLGRKVACLASPALASAVKADGVHDNPSLGVLGAGHPGGCLEPNSQEGSRGKGQNDRRKREALLPPQGPFCEITGRTATRRCEE